MSERKLSLFDIDRTVYDGFLIFPLAEQQSLDGIIASKTPLGMNRVLEIYRQGMKTYEVMAEETLQIWASGLKGKEVGTVFRHAERYLQVNQQKYYPYVEKVIALLRETHDIFFVTAGPQFTAIPTSRRYVDTKYISTIFEIEEDRFTGKITRSLANSSNKQQSISEISTSHDTRQSFAFGDSEGDIDMLAAAEYAICVNPTEGLQTVANEKGWYVPPKLDEIPSYVAHKLNNL
jgi:HAD superfamily phosphoserine phosphatase-like hydrolase